MLLDQHTDAISYDLMTIAHRSIYDVGESLDWLTLKQFLFNLPITSALYRAREPKVANWVNGGMTAFILADMYDALSAFLYQHACANTSKKSQRPKKPKPYPRPFDTIDNSNEKKFGKDAIPAKDFQKWWDSH